jgi:hypothetical protein
MCSTGTETAQRNAEIWKANRMLGIGTARLAADHGVSRERIKQIIAKEDQKRERGPYGANPGPQGVAEPRTPGSVSN